MLYFVFLTAGVGTDLIQWIVTYRQQKKRAFLISYTLPALLPDNDFTPSQAASLLEFKRRYYQQRQINRLQFARYLVEQGYISELL